VKYAELKDYEMKQKDPPIIGYQLALHGNDTLMYRFDDEVLERCPVCGFRLSIFQHRPDYSTKQRLNGTGAKRLDIAVTQDDQIIVSQAVRDFCIENEYEGLDFLSFENDRSHFQLKIERKLRIDRDRIKSQYGKMCPACERYNAVVTGWMFRNLDYNTYNFFETNSPVDDGFYLGDIWYARVSTQFPIIVIGIETRAKLRAAGIKITVIKAYGFDPDFPTTFKDWRIAKTQADPTPKEAISTLKIRGKRRHRD